jgi:hypothetical protein
LTKAREKRNRLIKQAVKEQLELGLNLKEALYVVAEDPKWGLSKGQVERIYYETRME